MRAFLLDVGHTSHVGQHRGANEDALGLPRPDQAPAQRKQMGHLLAVADGMGGEAGGRWASQHAIATLYESYYDGAEQDPEAGLARAFAAANREVHEAAEQKPDLSRMGTTLTAAVVRGDHLYVGHAGDSRAYLLREGHLRQLTQDHTWVNDALAQGIISAEEAVDHPQRHVLSRALGRDEKLDVDFGVFDLHEGDLLLLCSDGLTNLVSDEELAKALMSTTPQDAADALTQLANDRGGYDNISVIVARVDPQPRRERAIGRYALAMVASLAFVFGLGLLVRKGVDEPLQAEATRVASAEGTSDAAALALARVTGTAGAASAAATATAAQASVLVARSTATRAAIETQQAATAQRENARVARATRDAEDELDRIRTQTAQTQEALPTIAVTPFANAQVRPLSIQSPSSGDRIDGCVQFRWAPVENTAGRDALIEVQVCEVAISGPNCVPSLVVKSSRAGSEAWDPGKQEEIARFGGALDGQPGRYRWRASVEDGSRRSPVTEFTWLGGDCGDRGGDDDEDGPGPEPTVGSGTRPDG